MALVTLDPDPSAVLSDATGLATNLPLPDEAKTAWDGKPGSVTMGDASVSIRLIHIDGSPVIVMRPTARRSSLER